MELKCPICNEKQLNPAVGVSCDSCGYAYAYVNAFCNKKSYELWMKKADEFKKQLVLNEREEYSAKACFVLGSDQVAFISPLDNKLMIFGGDGSFEIIDGVLIYSKSERNSAYLDKQGLVTVRGNNDYRQWCSDTSVTAKYVMCAPTCTYIVDNKGDVLIYGIEIDSKIKKWKNIVKMACGSYHVLGLTSSGTVNIAGEVIEKSIIKKVATWNNVKSICAATDCSIALLEDGTVSFAGRTDDPRSKAEEWDDIIDIKVDSSYAVGLKRDGSIVLAGSCKSFLDMDRSTAASWKNVLAITCSKSGIAAILTDGSLRVVGNFSGELENIYKLWNQKVKI